MKRTEKSRANSRQKSIANSRQKSMANSRQKDKSRPNNRQGKPKGYDRVKTKYEANYEEKHSTEESCSQPVPKHLRTDGDVQEGQWELKLDDVIRPSQNRLRRRNRGAQEDHPDKSETATQKVHRD